MGRPLTIEEINNRQSTETKLIAVEISRSLQRASGARVRYCMCICACGGQKEILVSSLVGHKTLSCGCIQRERDKRMYDNKHIRQTYRKMIDRCYNPKNKGYKSYGAKGVIVCKEWLESYKSFENWSLQNGWAIGLHLDKEAKGKYGLYSPDTCGWVTYLENSKSRLGTLKFEFHGETLTLREISNKTGVNHATMWGRLTRGIWNIYEASNPKLMTRGKKQNK